MEIEGGSPVGNVGEYAIDVTMAQLLATAPSFRRWFIRQIRPDTFPGRYLGGTTHASYANEGESDVEFGFVTEAGHRHLMLIENKIAAAVQPNQFERYYKRGRFRTEREEWDSFSVCLLAPAAYVTEDDAARVDVVISYEAVLEQLESLTNDSVIFFESVFESALETSTIPDASETLQTIAQRVQETDLGEQIEPVQGQNKSLIFHSTHPDHPDAVGYNVYIAKKGPGGKTRIRLKIGGPVDVPPEEIDAIRSIVSAHRDSLPEYEWKLDRKSDIGAKTLWHDELPDDVYIDTVVAELAELVETFQPVFLEQPLR